MEFSAEQQIQIDRLVRAGFPDGLAKMSVIAKSAGMKDAETIAAGLVKVLVGNEDRTKADTAARKQILMEGLAKVQGKSDQASLTAAISYRRQLSELDNKG